MRITSIILAVGVAGLAWSVSAQPTGGQADNFLAELDRQCPQRELQFLSPGSLRDGLDDYVSSLSTDAQDAMRRAESAQCSSSEAGVTCVNLADIGVADQLNLTSPLATSICSSF